MSYFIMINRCVEFYTTLFTGTALFLVKQGRRRFFVLRVLLSYAFCVLLMNQLYFSILTVNRNMTPLGNFAIYGSALLLMWPLTYFCFRVSWGDALFCAVAGYSAQFLQSITSEYIWRSLNLSRNQQVLTGVCVAVAYFVPLYLYSRKKLQRGQNFRVDKWQLMLLLTAVIAVEIIICYEMRQLWIYVPTDYGTHMAADCALLAICSLIVLVAQFSLLIQQDLSDELRIINQMYRRNQEQYHISRETIDLINQKCHDMRFQIRNIGESAHVTHEALQSMEETISIYDSIYNTGSYALDIILTEKSLLCRLSGTVINCIADASALQFISDADIYALFGNLLENAMHAVAGLPADLRVIDLIIRRQNAFLSINIRNCFDGKLRLENGMPVTSKADKDYHGFGVKSISSIVRKYGGTISFQAKDNVFNVNILFNLGQEKA